MYLSIPKPWFKSTKLIYDFDWVLCLETKYLLRRSSGLGQYFRLIKSSKINLSDRSKSPSNTSISAIQTQLGLKVSDNQRFHALQQEPNTKTTARGTKLSTRENPFPLLSGPIQTQPYPSITQITDLAQHFQTRVPPLIVTFEANPGARVVRLRGEWHELWASQPQLF